MKFYPGDTVRTTKGDRLYCNLEDDLEVIKYGNGWRKYTNVQCLDLRTGLSSYFLEKNLVRVKAKTKKVGLSRQQAEMVIELEVARQVSEDLVTVVLKQIIEKMHRDQITFKELITKYGLGEEWNKFLGGVYNA